MTSTLTDPASAAVAARATGEETVSTRRRVVRGHLDRLRDAKARATAAEVEVLVGAAEYADLVTCFAGSLDELLGVGIGLDEITAMCTPAVAELAEMQIQTPAEFGAALGLSSTGASRLIADALQLRHRLPLTWAQVLAGRVEAWRARRIAQATAGQPDDVVAAVDAHLATVAGKVGPVTLAKLLDAAMMRLHPEEREIRQQERLDQRHATLRRDISDGGVAHMEIHADLKDLLDFDHTLSRIADALVEVLADEGRAETKPVRRTLALGVLADPQAAADLLRDHDGAVTPGDPPRPWDGDPDRPHPADGPEPTAPDDTGGQGADGHDTGPTDPVTSPAGAVDPTRDLAREIWPLGYLPPASSRPACPPRPAPPGRAAPTPARRQLVLYAHVSADALRGHDVLARLETPGPLGSGSGEPLLETVVRDWCGRPGTQVIVKPVIDLSGHQRTDAYEIPDRMREHVILRDGHCAFPWCDRSARTCDLDHIVAHGAGGATCPCNLAPLCRHHHNLKTHHGWSYLAVEPGTWLWTTPLGYTLLVGPDGTRDVTPPGHDPGDGCPQRQQPNPHDEGPAVGGGR